MLAIEREMLSCSCEPARSMHAKSPTAWDALNRKPFRIMPLCLCFDPISFASRVPIDEGPASMSSRPLTGPNGPSGSAMRTSNNSEPSLIPPTAAMRSGLRTSSCVLKFGGSWVHSDTGREVKMGREKDDDDASVLREDDRLR